MSNQALNAKQGDKLSNTDGKNSETVTKAVETVKKNYDESIKQASAGLNKVANQTIKTVENLSKSQKESHQVFEDIAKIIQKSCDDIGSDALDCCKNISELQLATFKDSLTARNLQDLLKIHSNAANAIYNDYIANANKITKQSHATINSINQHYSRLLKQITNRD